MLAGPQNDVVPCLQGGYGGVIEFRVLGPVQVWVAGRQLNLGTPRQRAVLAVLVAEDGRPVPAETLIDRVWADSPPSDPRRAVYGYVSRLRRILSAGPAGALNPGPKREPGGYRLAITPDQVDRQRMRRLAEQAREAGRASAERVRLLDDALALWRGTPLVDLTGEWAARVQQLWQAEYLDLVVEWAHAATGVGHLQDVVGRVRGLAAEYPLVEPLAAALIRSLAATGRRGEALECFAGVRARLVEELGAEPGRELRQLHQALLRGQPIDPDSTSAQVTPTHSASPATKHDDIAPARSPSVHRLAASSGRPPKQLPADVFAFTGRNADLLTLAGMLPGSAAAQPPGVPIMLVSGTAGVGKTALAVHWAHQAAAAWPDGQLYIDLRGYDPEQPLPPGEALGRFLRALGVPAADVPLDVEECAARYRSELAGRRVLVLLDNAATADQIRPLLPGEAACAVLVTSRDTLPGLVAVHGARRLRLAPLALPEALALLAALLPNRIAAEPDAVATLAELCARLPLALRIAAELAAARPDTPIADLVVELHDGQQRLNQLDAGGESRASIAAVFSWSLRRLPPRTSRLFRLLGVHPGPDIDPTAAAALAGIEPTLARHDLDTLTRAHLLHTTTAGRYGMHDLLRAYATELLQTHDTTTDRHAALDRLLEHYLHTAHTADALLDPARDPITIRRPTSPGILTDRNQAMHWFTIELPVLLAMVQQSAHTAADFRIWQLAWSLVSVLDLTGRWQDWTTTQQTALAVAERIGDFSAQAITHRLLGRAYLRLSQYEQAQIHLQRAGDLYNAKEDNIGEAHTILTMAETLRRQGRLCEALDHARRALDMYRTNHHRIGQANALNATGWYHTLLGEHQAAIECCQQALGMLQELDDHRGEANTWDSLGHAHHHLGNADQAVVCYHRALDIYRAVGAEYREAETLDHLGEAHHAAGNNLSATAAWQHAYRILDNLGHHDSKRIHNKLNTSGQPTPPQLAPHTTRH